MTLPLSTVRRIALAFAFAGVIGACLLPGIGVASAAAADEARAATDHSHDFDLFFGTWHSKQRRLKQALAGNDEWDEFVGVQTTQPLLGGHANTTDNQFTLPDGSVHRGVTLRAYDPTSQTWSIWWLSSTRPTKIDVPVVGTFENGVGTFYADDVIDGKPVKVRFLWLNITPTTRRWEQAYSPDGGKTWETNWTADFSRPG